MQNRTTHRCPHCGCTHIVQTREADLVCTGCGFVLEGCMLDYKIEHMLSAGGCEVVYASEQEKGNNTKYTKKKKDICDLLIEEVVAKTHIPEAIVEDAVKMLTAYNLGTRHYMMHLAAAVYYCQRAMNQGCRTKDELCNALILDPTEFSKTCTVLKDRIYQDAGRRPLLDRVNTHVDILGRLIREVCLLENIDHHRARLHVVTCNLFKRMESELACKHLVQSMKLEKLLVGVLYVGLHISKHHISKKHMSDHTNTSVATIIKVEAALQTLLRAKPGVCI